MRSNRLKLLPFIVKIRRNRESHNLEVCFRIKDQILGECSIPTLIERADCVIEVFSSEVESCGVDNQISISQRILKLGLEVPDVFEQVKEVAEECKKGDDRSNSALDRLKSLFLLKLKCD